MAISISIVDHELPYDNYNTYDVDFHEWSILTMVTSDPSMVDSWIDEIKRIHSHRLHKLIVGIDVEWRPNFNRNIENPVATLQLCVGQRCLIFQLIYASFIPQSLREFLENSDYTFVGVGIESDVEKLLYDYEFGVNCKVDIGILAADRYGSRALRNAGLKGLAREVLGLEIQKPRRVTLSRWDYEWLTPAQVQYACIDAFLSFEIGRALNASGN